jgi:c-di-GMP-related signal transduction protein
MLGRSVGETAPGSLFLMGLCSVLPQLMQMALADALASLQLPPEAEQALLRGTGPWTGYIALLEALEAPDMSAAKPLSEPFGGLDKVLAMSARSWMPE